MQNLTFLDGAFMLAAYLLGAFNSAITLSKIMGFADPRSEGSNNPGATNVMRIAGKKAAALTLLIDVLKGLLPVLLAQYLLQAPFYIALTGIAAFLGHCYPLYYDFRGGKGVATAIGFILAFHWPSGLAVVAIWLIVAIMRNVTKALPEARGLLQPADPATPYTEREERLQFELARVT
ncbi:MAG: glycerol-3-phosphate 1-O-acyltransferase PlsY, partial [Mariprofundaceae bacterium]|nr:glycerol-3-phosphate 1-O-acyltransferase PlsY [Mariprofundaceae bacterium]